MMEKMLVKLVTVILIQYCTYYLYFLFLPLDCFISNSTSIFLLYNTMNATLFFFHDTQKYSLSFIIAQIEDKASIIPLVAGMRKEVQALISEGIQLVWESYKLDPYVQKFSDTIVSFQERVEELVLVGEQLEVDIRSLETCPYSANTFADILAKIQHAVDDLSLKQYSNLHIWVSRLDDEVS